MVKPWIVILISLCLIWAANAYNIVAASQKAEELSIEGRRLYDNIVSLAESPDVDTAACWDKAFGNFQREVETCGKLDDVAKNLISFSLMKCHLGDRDDILAGCHIDEALRDFAKGKKTRAEHLTAIKKCKSIMPISAAGIQLQFYNHLELICFHFESKAWQQRTDAVVSRLSDTSSAVAETLTGIKESEDKLLRMQEISLQNQEQLIGSASRLQNAISDGHSAIEGSIEGMKLDLDQAKSRVQLAFEDIFGMVNRVIEFQGYVSSQLWDFASFLLYGGLVFVTHYITSSESTKKARGSMFVCLTLMVLGELAMSRFISMPLGQSVCSLSSIVLRDMRLVQSEVWDTTGYYGCQILFKLVVKWWRMSFIAANLSIFLRSWWTYRDPSTKFSEALQDGFENIWAQLEELVDKKQQPRDEPKYAAIVGLDADSFPDYCSSDDSDWEAETDVSIPTQTIQRRNPFRKARPTNFVNVTHPNYNPILHYETPQMFADRVELNALRSKVANQHQWSASMVD